MSDTELRNESPEGLDPASPHLYEQLSSEIGGVLESMDELSDYLERVVSGGAWGRVHGRRQFNRNV